MWSIVNRYAWASALWIERMLGVLEGIDRPLIIGTEDSGWRDVLAASIVDSGRNLWVDFGRTSRQITRADMDFLAELSWGLPVPTPILDAVSARRVHVGIIGPGNLPSFTISGVELSERIFAELLKAYDGVGRLIFISRPDEAARFHKSHPQTCLLTPGETQVNHAEAEYMVGQQLSDGEFNRLRTETSLRFDQLTKLVNAGLGLPDVTEGEPAFSTPVVRLTPSPATLVDLLKRNARWQKALDVAIQFYPEQIEEVIDLAAEESVRQGTLSAFERKLKYVPEEVSRSDRVLYWRLFTAASHGLAEDIKRTAAERINANSPPKLRLLAAALDVVPLESAVLNSLEKSVEFDSPSALNYAHLLATSGNTTRAIPMLENLYSMYRKAGRVFRTVHALVLLANAKLLHGNFASASLHAETALDLTDRHNIQDQQLRFVCIALTSFIRLLSGDDGKAAELLHSIDEAVLQAVNTGYESVHTTIGDLSMVEGNFANAEAAYRRVFNGLSTAASDSVLPDLVLALYALGRSDEALALALGRITTTEPERMTSGSWCVLAEALALSLNGDHRGKGLLETISTNRGGKWNALQRSRAVIHLALHYHRVGAQSKAITVLASHQALIHQLGESGWILLGGANAHLGSLRAEWLATLQPIQLEFLGGSDWLYKSGSEESLGSNRLRIMELLFCLSMFPEGINTEGLLTCFGWSPESALAMRTLVKSLRQFVEVGTKPYRLERPVAADYITLTELIDSNELDRALDLYKGPLLPNSEIPFVIEHRTHLETLLRIAVLESGMPELLARLATKFDDDLELVEEALKNYSEPSTTRTRLLAQRKRILKKWESD